MRKLFTRIKHWLLDLILPLECLNCRQEGCYFCDACFNKLSYLPPASQVRLSQGLISDQLDNLIIIGHYEQDPLLKRLIIYYKYRFLAPLSLILGKYLVSALKKYPQLIAPLASKSVLLIPLPLSSRRQAWRGFSQTQLLAEILSETYGWQLSGQLKRPRHRPPQAKLKREQRLENVANVFTWTGESLAGKTIILLDDVITTGATLNEASRILREQGALAVWGLVVAKG
ncbi:MAG: ComF family protein [Patescibacteria group bacterium]